jgi:hypothetical protein
MDCVRCKSQNPDENQYCGKCGAILDGSIGQIKTLLEATLRDEIHSAIADQFKDQKLASYEITESVVDRLLNWAKILGVVVGIPLTLVIGKSCYDLRSSISQGKEEVAAKVINAKNELGTEVDQGKKDLSASVVAAKNEAEVVRKEADSAEVQMGQTEAKIRSLDPRLAASEAIVARVAALKKKIDDVEASLNVQSQLIFSALNGQVTLNRHFVNQIKDRATMAIQFEIDVHLRSPHSISSGGNDGDLPMAGRAPEVKLPVVAEIMNARKERASIELLNKTPPGQSVGVEGAWRIWFEHPSQEEQTQGDPVDLPTASNPEHVFEIHPVTSIGGEHILDSLVEIPGYQSYPASLAFPVYDLLTASVIASAETIKISSETVGYN